jgi:hypothetical protein
VVVVAIRRHLALHERSRPRTCSSIRRSATRRTRSACSRRSPGASSSSRAPPGPREYLKHAVNALVFGRATHLRWPGISIGSSTTPPRAEARRGRPHKQRNALAGERRRLGRGRARAGTLFRRHVLSEELASFDGISCIDSPSEKLKRASPRLSRRSTHEWAFSRTSFVNSN